MSNSLEGQIALVTGAMRGIGRAIAFELGRQGATVVGTATTDETARELAEALAAEGIEGGSKPVDVTDAAASEALVDWVEKEFGTVGILVNNAGITRDNLAMRMKDDEWDAVIDVNLKATFRMSRLVMRGMMKARAGRIISITSVVGSTGNPGQVNYAASKAGVAGMSRCLARELGSRNITVNCVAPGFIDTLMTQGLPDTVKENLCANIALGRLGTAEEVAQAVAFLASPAAAYITGQTLHVNGGMYTT
ncbi:MAG: 3-oxoacyl-ACP reductase FabG [Azoarcus sp.]|jgi:3-oxoacyl-[acyl-carrier protein] reductase|nr:3-oxoacyl-ACP reductase FabG [Azoarcus sp.]